MCQLTPIVELENLKFSVSALAQFHPGGSYQKENAENAARAIRERLDWCIRQMKAADEGKRYMGA